VNATRDYGERGGEEAEDGRKTRRAGNNIAEVIELHASTSSTQKLNLIRRSRYNSLIFQHFPSCGLRRGIGASINYFI